MYLLSQKSLRLAAAGCAVMIAALLFFGDEAFQYGNFISFPMARPLSNSEWSDAMLYLPAGQAHRAWRLLPSNQIAPFTAEAQELLLAQQFPVEGCKNKRFLVGLGHGDNGIGSNLHVSTYHLSTAFELGRIFIWGKEAGITYTDPKTCLMRNFECFFRAPSLCTLQDARAPGADTVDLGSVSLKFGLGLAFVPTKMKELWRKRDQGLLPQAMELKYWWRAQAVAFLARFNDATTHALRKLRTNSSAILLSLGAALPVQHYQSPQVGIGWEASREGDFRAGSRKAEAFPFERGMVSLHVRHGDKGGEMALVPDSAYFAAAELLVKLNPMSLVRAAFISTEDPGTLVAASKEEHGWAMMWYNVPRINSNGADQLEKLQMPKAILTQIWFLQLLMALECDAWVGTRRSNWNR